MPHYTKNTEFGEYLVVDAVGFVVDIYTDIASFRNREVPQQSFGYSSGEELEVFLANAFPVGTIAPDTEPQEDVDAREVLRVQGVAQTYLDNTDWYVTRVSDDPIKTIPQAVADARQAARELLDAPEVVIPDELQS